jgi:hypothetical protein
MTGKDVAVRVRIEKITANVTGKEMSPGQRL